MRTIIHKTKSSCYQRTLAEIEADPITAIVAIRAAIPDLTWTGFNESVDGKLSNFVSSRERMVSPWCVGQFVRAARWLDQAPRLKTVNRRVWTYHWKHVAERWNAKRDRNSDYYIGTGMFIAAAFALGLRVARHTDGTNGWVNISSRVDRERPNWPWSVR